MPDPLAPTWEPVEEIPEKKSQRPAIWHDLVVSFLASGHRFARVPLPEGRDPSASQGAICGAISKLGLKGAVACRIRGGEVYLERLTNGGAS